MDLEGNSSRQCGPLQARRAPVASYMPLFVAILSLACGCSETLDAGHDRAKGILPVDQRNPLILLNDGAFDNWSGEYAVLLANSGGSPLAAIIVNTSPDWPDIQTNVGGYRDLVEAARNSGLTNLPDPIASIEQPLLMPSTGVIADTHPNRSEGAQAIIALSRSLGLPYRPLVVATGGALTDVADAYLMDPTVAERVVVVSSLGSANSDGGGMGSPNGDRDPWADFIVASQFQYIQVSVWYDQLTDVPADRLSEVPKSELGDWITRKQPNLFTWTPAADQVSVLAAGLPSFVTSARHLSAASSLGAGTTVGPNLSMEKGGPNWLVTGCDGTAATLQFWTALRTTTN